MSSTLQTVVSSGGILGTVRGIAIAPTGELFVAENPDTPGGLRAILSVDPGTGAQTIVSSGGLFESLRGAVIDSNGDILVAQGNSSFNGIIRVDPTTGDQTVVSSGGNFVDPTGLALEGDGRLLAVDQEANALIRVDPTTGTQAVVSSGASLCFAAGLALDAAGRAIVADEGTNTLLRIDLSNGTQAVVSSGGLFDHPFGVVVEANGGIIVANGTASAGMVRVNPASGAQSSLSAGGAFRRPGFAAVVPGRVLSVSVTGTGAGSVTSTPGGISCPGDCVETYVTGRSVVLTALPAANSVLNGWLGDPECSTGTVILDADRTCTAVFNAIDTTAPSTTITEGPSGTIIVNTALFTWTGSDDRTPVSNMLYAFRLGPLEANFSAFGSATSTTYAGLAAGVTRST